MVFNSLEYLIFFPLVVLGYFLLPHRARWVWLLVASVFFYMMAVPVYILFMAGLILVDFVMGRMIETAEGRHRRTLLIIALILNFIPLFVFKYFNFLFGWALPDVVLNWVLPLGLSFHTFQSASYLIDVYRKIVPSERHLGHLALYVLFFPQLVAGPIERPAHLLPQLRLPATFDRRRAWLGLQLIGWGFFKKIVVADRLDLFVDQAYTHPALYNGPQMAVALVCFTIQLYADFSGYVDIARGSALVLGITLTPNFNRPYFSGSIAEFWRRWHMTLSSWFRDYLYFPLARLSPSRAWILYGATILTFLLTGLWHGAGWTFLIMGFIHGGAIALGAATKDIRARVVHAIGLGRVPRLHRTIQVIITFSIVTVSWVFFRASDLHQASIVLSRLIVDWPQQFAMLVQSGGWIHAFSFGYEPTTLILALIGVATVIVVEGTKPDGEETEGLLRKSVFVRAFTYAFIILFIIVFGEFRSKEFIYFQF